MKVNYHCIPFVFIFGIVGCASGGPDDTPKVEESSDGCIEMTEEHFGQMQQTLRERLNTPSFLASVEYLQEYADEIGAIVNAITIPTTTKLEIGGKIVSIVASEGDAYAGIQDYSIDIQNVLRLHTWAETFTHKLDFGTDEFSWSFESGNADTRGYKYIAALPFMAAHYVYASEEKWIEYSLVASTATEAVNASHSFLVGKYGYETINSATVNEAGICDPIATFWPNLIPFPVTDLRLTTITKKALFEFLVPPEEIWNNPLPFKTHFP